MVKTIKAIFLIFMAVLGIAVPSFTFAAEATGISPENWYSPAEIRQELDGINSRIKEKKARWQAAETERTRMSPSARANRLGLIPTPTYLKTAVQSQATLQAAPVTSSLPATLDWRNRGGNFVTGIRNQGNCGSCWAFGSTAGLESKTLIINNTPGVDLNLSEQVALSCSGAGSCNGGYLLTSYFVNTGLPLESCYPYTGTNGTCLNACSNWQLTAYKTNSYTWINPSGTQTYTDALKGGLNTYGPLVVTFQVFSDFDSYVSGVYSHVTGASEGWHAVLLVGYDDASSCFIVKNSWGKYWGESGFFRIAYSETTSVTQFGQEALAYGDNVSVVSAVTYPYYGGGVSPSGCTITGTATPPAGKSVQKVEVSTDGGITWATSTGTTSWSYTWAPGSPGTHNIRSRATDSSGTVEPPGGGVIVTVSAVGSPELQHYNWTAAVSGGCTGCHISTNKFLTAGYRDNNAFCFTCHNASGVAHEKSLRSHNHTAMVNVTTGGSRIPTYGNITAGEYNNEPFSKLNSGKVVCMTCHNTMRKYEDMGRTWEYTTTSDRKTYTLVNGGWAGYKNLVPNVYRDTTLWAAGGPSYSKTKKKYFVSPSEYNYNENNGTVTFLAAQSPSVYIYVSLYYPDLRASNATNTMCSDCHTQGTHKGNNCLTCHTAHNTTNIEDIRASIRAQNRTTVTVKFLRFTGINSFADGDSTHDGICEVCHTQTKYYRRDGSGFKNHSSGINYDRVNCTTCHTHQSGFSKR